MFKKILVLILTLSFLAGCGSGGESSPTRSRKAVATLKTANLAAQAVAAIQVNLTIPESVYVKGLQEGTVVLLDGKTPPVTLTGVTSGNVFISAQVIPADSTTGKARTFTFQVYKLEGFQLPQEIQVELDVRDGAAPKETDFTIPYCAVSHVGTFDAELKTVVPVVSFEY